MFALGATHRIRLVRLSAVAVLGLALSVVGALQPAAPAASAKAAEGPPVLRIATLNLEYTMDEAAMRNDISKVIDEAHATVIGFQERRDTRPALRAALPEHWALRMPRSADGTDDNPIAFDRRVWQSKNSWPRLLAGHTWRRDGGNEAVDQYGVVTVLQHRATGHVIRAVSFHMPSAIHNRESGGPNWAERDRVEAFWRMSESLRGLVSSAPADQQFVGLCDCNVTESRDTTDKLVRGKITRPLNLENNYSAAGYHRGWRIDYVMTQRERAYRIVDWRVMHDLQTDHPAVITKLRKR